LLPLKLIPTKSMKQIAENPAQTAEGSK